MAELAERELMRAKQEEVSGDDYEVERIEKHGHIDGELLFYIKWKGHEGKLARTWEPISNCGGATDLIAGYMNGDASGPAPRGSRARARRSRGTGKQPDEKLRPAQRPGLGKRIPDLSPASTVTPPAPHIMDARLPQELLDVLVDPGEVEHPLQGQIEPDVGLDGRFAMLDQVGLSPLHPYGGLDGTVRGDEAAEREADAKVQAIRDETDRIAAYYGIPAPHRPRSARPGVNTGTTSQHANPTTMGQRFGNDHTARPAVDGNAMRNMAAAQLFGVNPPGDPQSISPNVYTDASLPPGGRGPAINTCDPSMPSTPTDIGDLSFLELLGNPSELPEWLRPSGMMGPNPQHHDVNAQDYNYAPPFDNPPNASFSPPYPLFTSWPEQWTSDSLAGPFGSPDYAQGAMGSIPGNPAYHQNLPDGLDTSGTIGPQPPANQQGYPMVPSGPFYPTAPGPSAYSFGDFTAAHGPSTGGPAQPGVSFNHQNAFNQNAQGSPTGRYAGTYGAAQPFGSMSGYDFGGPAGQGFGPVSMAEFGIDPRQPGFNGAPALPGGNLQQTAQASTALPQAGKISTTPSDAAVRHRKGAADGTFSGPEGAQ